ncbi:helix-turn-helix domain-containing protein [Janibacter melonis]|uniref:helix-turn-helix transcriptional regulator n=1 Tax=Janibacter melonis TaxID=262209 RepID=UPI00204374DD|nr:helix-turn-helix domain-containing protein [Janibacter melonis]MCM3555904.1 helix-turn-helix domain-containing protein [Janibacter melonis]
MTATARPTRRFETLAAAAERTGFSVRTLRRRISEGQLPAYRSGPRSIRVDPADVDRLMVRIPTVGA